MLPGKDGKFNTRDDIIDPSIIGDVDLVLRTGGTFAGGAIPPPAATVAAAPVVTAGGLSTGFGSEVEFQVIVSDGVTPPDTGAPLTGGDMNGRGVFVLAYADLDGDGFIGPTDADGSEDNAVERQEIEVPAGRQVAIIANGVAQGSLGVSLGAPASIGGLGLVLVAGATTGPNPPLYENGPWIATRLPYMPEIDPERLLGHGNVKPPNPQGLVEIRLETEHFFLPAPGHPVLGTPYALPLDGSSPTIDTARAESAVARGAAFGLPVDPAAFVVGTGQLLPAVDPLGRRALIVPVMSQTLADDGPGNSVSLWLFPVDLIGNPADPDGDGFDVMLETGPSLRIVSPDIDGDPQHEPVRFAMAAAIVVTIDDAGAAHDGGATDRLTALVDGAVSGSMRVNLTGAANPTATPSATATPSVMATATETATVTATVTETATAPAIGTPTLTRTTTPVTTPPCVGDCNDSHTVTVAELVTGVNIALGRAALAACTTLDADSSGTVQVNELVAAVGHALHGCPR